MLKSVEGVYRDGKIELTERPEDIRDDTRVIVTFLETSPIDLRARGIDASQAAALTDSPVLCSYCFRLDMIRLRVLLLACEPV